jgi:hypothetical protein
MTDPSIEFNKVPIEIAKTGMATEAWVAVWANRDRGHMIIGAPTLGQLAERWEQITHSDLDPDMAQQVFICKRTQGRLIAFANLFAHDWT